MHDATIHRNAAEFEPLSMGHSSVGMAGISLSTVYTNTLCVAKRGDPHHALQAGLRAASLCRLTRADLPDYFQHVEVELALLESRELCCPI
jgi:hypothetical protein